MALEDLLQELIDAVKANTEALNKALNEEGETTPPASKPKPGKTKPARKAEPEEEPEAEAEEEPEAEAEEEPEAEAEDDEDAKREEALKWAKKAIAADRDAVVALLKKLGVKKVSEAPAAKLDSIIAGLKKIK